MHNRTTDLPDSIRAAIHEDAIQRVSRLFNATSTECFNELLQNSRRAGASRVDITIEDGLVTISDDGQGIADPGAVLAFGQSRWDNETARREDPAGMGVYALARKEDIVIRSHHPQTGAAWQVSLQPDHFTGQRAAPIIQLDPAETPAGTTVTFRDPGACTSTAEGAARYYPLPVTVNGQELGRRNFLERCFHVEQWRGLKIGISRYQWPLSQASLNFHGITIREDSVPSARCRDHDWYARIDVIDCPELELTLPARKEVVKTPFWKEVNTACRRAIYRSMAQYPEPVDLPRKVQMDAARLGIDLRVARPQLPPWKPAVTDHYASNRRTAREEVSPNDLVLACDLEVPDEQALGRAAERAGLLLQIRKADHDMMGYQWYDQLERIEDLTVLVDTGSGPPLNLYEAQEEGGDIGQGRVKGITMVLDISGPRGQRRNLEIPADVALWNQKEPYEWEGQRPLVTDDSAIDPGGLADMLMGAYFSPNDDSEADSYETQKDDFRDYVTTVATGTLLSEEETMKQAVTQAVDRHLRFVLPRGWKATVEISGGREVAVQVEKESGHGGN